MPATGAYLELLTGAKSFFGQVDSVVHLDAGAQMFSVQSDGEHPLYAGVLHRCCLSQAKLGALTLEFAITWYHNICDEWPCRCV